MLAQKELFDMMTSKGLTPNQYYLLSSMFDKLQTKHINVTMELNQLVYKEYVIVTKDNKLIPTEKAKKLVKSVESLFTKLAHNSAVGTLGEDYEERIKQYVELFPKGKLPSGKLARVNVKELKNAFKWFFENYDYDWDTILEATEKYIYESSLSADKKKFMRTSKYFIRKQEPDKTYVCELADCCENIINGDSDEDQNYFSVKVV